MKLGRACQSGGPVRPSRRHAARGESLVLAVVMVMLLALCVAPTSTGPDDTVRALGRPVSQPMEGAGQEGGATYATLSVTVSGLPPNVSAPLAVASIGPNGYWEESGPVSDGSNWITTLGNGSFTLSMMASPAPGGYIPYPASADIIVTNDRSVGIDVRFIHAWPCYQTFTEVGLPFGSEWWVDEAFGLSYFSNGTVIDAVGCPAIEAGATIGTNTDYHVIAFPTGRFYSGGAPIPVAFGPPAATLSLPAGTVMIIGLAVGVGSGIVAMLVHRPYRGSSERADARPPAWKAGEASPDSSSTETAEDGSSTSPPPH